MMWHYLSVYLYSVSVELSSPLPVCVLDTGCPCMSLEYFSPVRQAHLKQEEVNVNPYHTNGKVLFLWNSVLFSACTFEHLPWTSEISCSSGLNSVAFVTQQKIVKRKNGGKKKHTLSKKTHIIDFSVLHFQDRNVGFLTRQVFQVFLSCQDSSQTLREYCQLHIVT